MSKGYNNFMSKKAFHPGSFQNRKRIQEAEARAEAKRKHDEDTLKQYQKEQELFNQKNLVSRESKDKLSLSFMYDAPAGTSGGSQPGRPGHADTGDDILKWNKTSKVERKTEPNAKRKGDDAANGGDDDDDDDDEPLIVLKWKREEPKAKKASQQQQSVKPELKRIKKEPP